jgi:hypothetical protein
MHVDAIFHAAARSVAGQHLVDRGVKDHRQDGIDHSRAVSHGCAAALEIEHRMTINRANPCGKGVIPTAEFCHSNGVAVKNRRRVLGDRSFDVEVPEVVFQAEQRVWGRLPVDANRSAADAKYYSTGLQQDVSFKNARPRLPRKREMAGCRRSADD